MKTIPLIIGAILYIAVNVSGEIRIADNIGVGGRALSLANNYVALSNDVSASYWNPAAMAFSFVREFQISMDMNGTTSSSDFNGTDTSDILQRFRIGNAGLMVALPTSQGGFTFAVTFNNPIVFDDVSRVVGVYSSFPDTLDKFNKTFGGLRMWGGSFGVQVAQGLGLGLGVSMITGREDYNDEKTVYYPPDTIVVGSQLEINNYISNAKLSVKSTYVGIDARVGLLYTYNNLRLGARVVFPEVIHVGETYTGNLNDSTYEGNSESVLYSSYSGAAGASLELPFMTLSVEGRTTLPYTFSFPNEKISEGNSQAANFKIGYGAGVELPLPALPVVLRAGYSYDDYDLHPYVTKYDNKIDWSDKVRENSVVVVQNKNMLTAGIGIISKSVVFNFVYSYRFYALKTTSPDGLDVLDQNVKSQRILASLGFRY